MNAVALESLGEVFLVAKVKRTKGDANVSLDDLKVIAKGLGDRQLKAGFFESARYDEGTPVAYVAAIQEFGSPKRNIPPRSFFRSTIAEKSGEWARLVEDGLQAVINGELSMQDLLDTLGLRVAGQVRAKIGSITEPPLSPITLALRKQKRLGKTITGATVGATARAIAEGKTGPGELGDSSGINPKPLVFDGILFNSVTHVVD